MSEQEKQNFIKALRETEYLDEATFIKACGLTESKNFNIKEFDPVSVLAILCYLLGTVQPIADGLKKGLYYGPNKVAKYKNMAMDKTISEIAEEITDGLQIDWDEDSAYNLTQATYTQRRLIHAALGFITEGLELLEHVVNITKSGMGDSDLDWINIFEEKNDANWYGTIIPRAAFELITDLHNGDITEIGIRSINPDFWRAALIRKLIGKRYPDGSFDSEAQENRDVDAEYKAMKDSWVNRTSIKKYPRDYE